MSDLFTNPTFTNLVISSISTFILGVIAARVFLYKKRVELQLEHEAYMRRRDVEDVHSKESITKARDLTELAIKQREHSISVQELLDLEQMLNPATISDDSQMRNGKAIIAAETQYYERLWIVRHQVVKRMHAQGKLMPEQATHFQGALDAENLIKKKYGKENLIDLDQFDVGMISGKLSALRWVLGSQWDELWT